MAFVVELDRRMTGGAGSLLVRGEKRVFQCGDQRRTVDALFLLDDVHRLDDLAGHLVPRSIRLPRTIDSYGISTGSLPAATRRVRSPAATSSPRKRLRPAISSAVRTLTVRPTTRSKCGLRRSGRSVPGEETSIA